MKIPFTRDEKNAIKSIREHLGGITDPFFQEKYSQTSDGELLRFHYGADENFKQAVASFVQTVDHMKKDEPEHDLVDMVYQEVPWYCYGKDVCLRPLIIVRIKRVLNMIESGDYTIEILNQ